MENIVVEEQKKRGLKIKITFIIFSFLFASVKCNDTFVKVTLSMEDNI